MSTISQTVTAMQNETAYNKVNSGNTTMSDKDMFLSLMLQQMQNQDPTEPVDNQQWLSQLAQYSSLESAQNTQSAIEKLSTLVNNLSEAYSTSAGITQTLNLLGKEVTIVDPEDKTGGTKITGKVDEASFEDGTGSVKAHRHCADGGYPNGQYRLSRRHLPRGFLHMI